MDPNHEQLAKATIHQAIQLKSMFWPQELTAMVILFAGPKAVAAVPVEGIGPAGVVPAVVATVGASDADIAFVLEDCVVHATDVTNMTAITVGVVPRDDASILLLAPYTNGPQPEWGDHLLVTDPMDGDPLILAVREGYCQQALRVGPAHIKTTDEGMALVYEPCPCGSNKPVTVCCGDPCRN